MATAADRDAVRREKAAIYFLDSFIDSQHSKYGANHQISLINVEKHVQQSSDQDVKDYIVTSYDDTENFLVHRSYLWTFEDTSEDTLVKKQSSEWRQFFISLLKFLQKRNSGPYWGASLKALGCHIGKHAPSIKSELGRGNEIIKSTLLEYPYLFVWNPYTTDDTFINRAWVVGDVILLPELCTLVHPAYLEGVGTVYKRLPHSGFLQDDDTSRESIYFCLGEVDCLPLDHRVTTGQKFYFGSVLNYKFAKGESESKWVAISMQPVETNVSKCAKTEASSRAPSTMKLTTAVEVKRTMESVAAQRASALLENFLDSSPRWDVDLPIDYSANSRAPRKHDPWIESISVRLSSLQADSLIFAPVDQRALQDQTPIGLTNSKQTATTDMSTSTDIAEMRDYMIQTDPVPDRVEVLRLLHRNPGLAEVVETYIHAIRP